jgi:hypothetical protein
MADYLPCISLEEYAQKREQLGSIDAYMKPIIDQIAMLLITKDQSKLNDGLIKAIGVANYCRLVKVYNFLSLLNIIFNEMQLP